MRKVPGPCVSETQILSETVQVPRIVSFTVHENPRDLRLLSPQFTKSLPVAVLGTCFLGEGWKGGWVFLERAKEGGIGPMRLVGWSLEPTNPPRV